MMHMAATRTWTSVTWVSRSREAKPVAKELLEPVHGVLGKAAAMVARVLISFFHAVLGNVLQCLAARMPLCPRHRACRLPLAAGHQCSRRNSSSNQKTDIKNAPKGAFWFGKSRLNVSRVSAFGTTRCRGRCRAGGRNGCGCLWCGPRLA